MRKDVERWLFAWLLIMVAVVLMLLSMGCINVQPCCPAPVVQPQPSCCCSHGDTIPPGYAVPTAAPASIEPPKK